MIRPLILLSIASLWLPLWYALIPTWMGGQYYEYGWLVPPVAIFFAWHRAQDLGLRTLNPSRSPRPIGMSVLILAGFAVAAGLFALRCLELVDTTWRRVLIPHALLVSILTIGVLGWYYGRRVAFWFVPVIIFALSAVPWPSSLEQTLVGSFTDGVVAASAEFLRLIGVPITVRGDILVSLAGEVEVTEGCSGLRSFQSLLMGALFIGELHRLPGRARLELVVAGAVFGMVTNIGRTVALSMIRLDHGQQAFDQWHDRVGMIAFVVAILLLFFLSRWMESRTRRAKPRPQGAPATDGAPLLRSRLPGVALFVIGLTMGVEALSRGWFALRPDPAGSSRDLVGAYQRLPATMRQVLDIHDNPSSSALNFDEAEWLRIGDRAEPGAPAIDLLWFRYNHDNPRFFLDVCGHAPENCMAARGQQVAAFHPQRRLASTVGELEFRSLEFSPPKIGQPLFVFKTRWIVGMGSYALDIGSYAARFRVESALRGEKPPGAVVVLAAVTGCDTEAEAWAFFADMVFDVQSAETTLDQQQ